MLLEEQLAKVQQGIDQTNPQSPIGQILAFRKEGLRSEIAKVHEDRFDAIRTLLSAELGVPAAPSTGRIVNIEQQQQSPIVEMGIPESQETPIAGLRFSRRESGESEGGIHRLAQPQASRYESPQDERNDPAATLGLLRRGIVQATAQQRWKPGRRLASYAGLLAWSREHGKILDPSRFTNMEGGVGGGEHVVFRAADQPGRLYKLTKPGLFGAQGEDAGKYLQRWALANRVLGDEVRYEGMVTLPGETEARAVISQPAIRGRDATDAEQADYLRSKGFVEEDGRWIHPILGVSVWDTITPGNVIVQPDGTMQAVDLQIGPAKADDLEAVRNRTGFGRPTVFSKTGSHPENEIIRRANEPIKVTEGKADYPTLNPTEALKWLREPANGIIGEHENPDTGLTWNVSGNSFSKMVKQGVKSGEPVGAHAVRIAASYHLPELIRNAKGFEVEDLRNDANVARLYDLFAPFRFNGTLYRLRIKGKVFHNQGNKAHSMRVDDIVAEKVPLEGNGNLASESPRMTTTTNGDLTVRELFRGVNPYSGSVFSIGQRMPGTELPEERVSRSSREVQFWVGEATAHWPTKLPIIVHDSAEAIPNATLREQVAAEGDVEGFYNGADGSIHILADRVSSLEAVRRVVRHEGLHWAFDGPLRQEYLDILSHVAKSIPEDRLREIASLYKNQGPKVWVEEYLVQEGQNASNSPIWRQFVYEVKRLLRRVFGDKVEFSDADVRAFLSKAGNTLEGRKAFAAVQREREATFALLQKKRIATLSQIDGTDPQSATAEILRDRLRNLNAHVSELQAQHNPWSETSAELRFAKTPKRESWNEVRNGDNWNSVKRLFPKEPNVAPVFDTRGSKDEVVARAARFLRENAVVQDRKGRMVYLPYGQTKGAYGDPVLNRAEHITGVDESAGAHFRTLDPEKAMWLAAVPETIRNARVRVYDGNEVLYFRSYGRITHQVTTGAEGVIINQTTYDSGLVTQFPRDLSRKRFGEDAKVELLSKPFSNE